MKVKKIKLGRSANQLQNRFHSLKDIGQLIQVHRFLITLHGKVYHQLPLKGGQNHRARSQMTGDTDG